MDFREFLLPSADERATIIEPDMKISRIRLSDKTSRLHPRHVVPKPAQAHEPEVPKATLPEGPPFGAMDSLSFV
jgi:hypothetical protein